LAGGKAPVTTVLKLFSSHFRISQQFFRLDTPVSRVDRALWRRKKELLTKTNDDIQVK
jgi:hypothetical protein